MVFHIDKLREQKIIRAYWQGWSFLKRGMIMFGLFESDERNAVEILRQDHTDLLDLFDRFEIAAEKGQRKQIVADVIQVLKAHAAMEEEIFYPCVRWDVGDKIMNEAEEEHHVAKLLVAELEKMTGDEARFDAKFRVLAESVRHHIAEEDDHMLPQAAKADIDFEALGGEMLARREELLDKGFPLLPEEKLLGVRAARPRRAVHHAPVHHAYVEHARREAHNGAERHR
jgi:hypothetical protein